MRVQVSLSAPRPDHHRRRYLPVAQRKAYAITNRGVGGSSPSREATTVIPAVGRNGRVPSQGVSSAARTAASKPACRGFESLTPCCATQIGTSDLECCLVKCPSGQVRPCKGRHTGSSPVFTSKLETAYPFAGMQYRWRAQRPVAQPGESDTLITWRSEVQVLSGRRPGPPATPLLRGGIRFPVGQLAARQALDLEVQVRALAGKHSPGVEGTVRGAGH